MWEAAVKVGSEAMLDGLGRVRRCSLEGRAGMSLDLSAVEKALRGLAPGAALASLRLVSTAAVWRRRQRARATPLLPA